MHLEQAAGREMVRAGHTNTKFVLVCLVSVHTQPVQVPMRYASLCMYVSSVFGLISLPAVYESVSAVYSQSTRSLPAMYRQCTSSVLVGYQQFTGGLRGVFQRYTNSVPAVYQQCTSRVPAAFQRCNRSLPAVYQQCARSVPAVCH